jgi:hypothetical protein
LVSRWVRTTRSSNSIEIFRLGNSFRNSTEEASDRLHLQTEKCRRSDDVVEQSQQARGRSHRCRHLRLRL